MLNRGLAPVPEDHPLPHPSRAAVPPVASPAQAQASRGKRGGAVPSDASPPGIDAELVAVLVAVTGGQPRVLTIDEGSALPSGPFRTSDRSLQSGLRAWVEQQTGQQLGYVEQLYTFADRGRVPGSFRHVISISYLGLTREHGLPGGTEAGWRDWYGYVPWENHRQGPPAMLAERLVPALLAWAAGAPDPGAQRQRVAISFGLDGLRWHEEFALQRYELLFQAGLIPEAGNADPVTADPVSGRPMASDHRRILTTAIARLRAKIQYRPVVFELMPPAFTLLQLQQGVEAIAGKPVHKGNFRRLIEAQELVEETGETTLATGGRPARLMRFRREVLAERAVVGTKLPLSRS